MNKGAFLLALAVLAGCAERDNPYDPSNLPPKSPAEPKTDLWVPKPGGHVKVLLEDSARKYQGVPNPPFAGNLMSVLSQMVPDDTLYIYGGGGEYPISGRILIKNKGALDHPIVILPFGGRVRFRLVPDSRNLYQQHCLKIEDSHVKIVGITCVGGDDFGLKAGVNLLTDGSLDLDSVSLENPGGGIEISNIRGRVRIRNLTIINAYHNEVPVHFVGNDLLDTSNIFW